MDPYEISQSWTNRQYLVALTWLNDRINNPGLFESYMMQVAVEVRRGRMKNPKNVDIQDMKLTFSEDGAKEQQGPMTPEEAKRYSDWHKQVLAARWKLKEVPKHVR